MRRNRKRTAQTVQRRPVATLSLLTMNLNRNLVAVALSIGTMSASRESVVMKWIRNVSCDHSVRIGTDRDLEGGAPYIDGAMTCKPSPPGKETFEVCRDHSALVDHVPLCHIAYGTTRVPMFL